MVRTALLILFLALAAGSSVPVHAPTTLGNLNCNALYGSSLLSLNPTDALSGHAPGPVGYVWPGSGLDMYSGIATNPHKSYARKGAILASTADRDSVGDLIFAINFSQPQVYVTAEEPRPNFTYSTVALYIPAPVADKYGAFVQDGFQPQSVSWDNTEHTNIVTSITNDYGQIFVTRADANDPFSPGSWLVLIDAPITFTAARHWKEWYYIRINAMKAPHIVGRYFFKIFLDNRYPVRSQSLTHPISSTMPVENWPVLLVKGEVDPPFMSGTIRYGNLNSALYGLPINLPGRVRAIGIASDPMTGRLTGRAVEARDYFNATSRGHYEIRGMAPGLYTVYASAAGLPEQKIADNVRVTRCQSLDILDGYLQVGPQLRGTVFSKQGYGTVNWAAQRPISIIIYDSKSYDLPSIVTSSPINLTHSPYTSYVVGNTTFNKSGFSGLTDEPGLPGLNRPKKIAFPWEGPTSYYAYTSSNFKDPYGVFNGVGPAQAWWVDPRSSRDPNTSLGSSSSEFVFQFGAESVYGVPTKFSGMVPQVFATWTDSLTPGRYYIRAFLNGYVQTDIGGTTFVDYSFDVPYIGTSNVFVPIDLIQSCGVNVTVHFHNLPGSLVDNPIQGPDPARYLIAEAFTRDEKLSAFNFTKVNGTQSSATILLNGLGMAGDPRISFPSADPRTPIKYSLARYQGKYSLARYQGVYDYGAAGYLYQYQGLYDYGLPPDTYTIRVYMRGFIQAVPPATDVEQFDWPLIVSLSLGSEITGACACVSVHMYRGGSVNVTVRSTDWQFPRISRNWVWQNAPVTVCVYDVKSQGFVDAIYVWNSNLQQWMLPFQDSSSSILPWPSWKSFFGNSANYLVTNGSVYVDRFGPDLPDQLSTDPSQDMATSIFSDETLLEGFLYDHDYYRTIYDPGHYSFLHEPGYSRALYGPPGTGSYSSKLAIYPGLYALKVFTYGYVQENVTRVWDSGKVRVSVPSLGSQADSVIPAIIGANFTLRILFKTENIFSGIPYNMSVRIRLMDASGALVAAAILSPDVGRLIPTSHSGFFADNMKLLSQSTVPAGTVTLEYSNLAGLFSYVEPSNSRLSVARWTLFTPDYGIWARSSWGNIGGSYVGPWNVVVDMVNWYLPSKFYPPVPGLLQGESPHLFTYNHLGPYRQVRTTISNVVLGGEGSVVFSLDLRGYAQGLVLGLDCYDAVRTMSWATVKLESGGTAYYWYSWDGWFDGYLNPGTYQATIAEWTGNQGHTAVKFVLPVSRGQQARALNFILEESNIPIPEFPNHSVIAISITSVAALIINRKRRRNREI